MANTWGQTQSLSAMILGSQWLLAFGTYGSHSGMLLNIFIVFLSILIIFIHSILLFYLHYYWRLINPHCLSITAVFTLIASHMVQGA